MSPAGLFRKIKRFDDDAVLEAMEAFEKQFVMRPTLMPRAGMVRFSP